jgi:lipoate---protein ligase
VSGPAVSGPAVSGPAVSLARTIRVVEAEGPALVLGSSQPESQVDRHSADRAGVVVTRRRSGGGAVLVGPGEVLWIDILIPVDDPLWIADVGRAGWWLGECWSRAIAAVTGGEPQAWRGEMLSTRWSPMICFAGLGPGEVTRNGRKVVGVSQRRTRRGVLFQTAALLRWHPATLLDLFSLPPDLRIEAESDLGEAAAGLGEGLAPDLEEALLAEVQRAD